MTVLPGSSKPLQIPLVDFSTAFRSLVSLVHGRLYQHIYVVSSPGSVAIRKIITYRWSLASGSQRPSTLLRLQTTPKEQLWAAPWSFSSISTRRVNRSKQGQNITKVL